MTLDDNDSDRLVWAQQRLARIRWHFTSRLTFRLIYYITQVVYKETIITVSLWFLLFICFEFLGRFPVSPLIAYNIMFVQRGFAEHSALE
jgi:hypothetical protein